MDVRRSSGRLPSLRAVEEALPMYTPRLQLGAGSFGRVFLMEHRQTGEKVAVKTLKKERVAELGMQDKVRREIKILLRVKHPNVIRLYNVMETNKYILLVMEYAANGELFDYITQRGRLTEGEARRIFQQIVSGVEYCHRHMVVHRDLKPENILMDHFWNVKVADFGLGNLMAEGHFLRTSCGSPNYAAPEVISGRLYCGPEVDIWGCGVVLYTLLAGRLPFDEKSHVALYQKIKAGAYARPTHVTPAVQDLLARLLVVDPTLRASMPEIRRHPWFLPWFLPADLLRLQEEAAAGRSPPPLQLNAASIENLQAVKIETDGRAVLAGNAVQEAFAKRFLGGEEGGMEEVVREAGLGLQGGEEEGRVRAGRRVGRERAPAALWSEDGMLRERIWGRAKWTPCTPLTIKCTPTTLQSLPAGGAVAGQATSSVSGEGASGVSSVPVAAAAVVAGAAVSGATEAAAAAAGATQAAAAAAAASGAAQAAAAAAASGAREAAAAAAAVSGASSAQGGPPSGAAKWWVAVNQVCVALQRAGVRWKRRGAGGEAVRRGSGSAGQAETGGPGGGAGAGGQGAGAGAGGGGADGAISVGAQVDVSPQEHHHHQQQHHHQQHQQPQQPAPSPRAARAAPAAGGAAAPAAAAPAGSPYTLLCFAPYSAEAAARRMQERVEREEGERRRVWGEGGGGGGTSGVDGEGEGRAEAGRLLSHLSVAKMPVTGETAGMSPLLVQQSPRSMVISASSPVLSSIQQYMQQHQQQMQQMAQHANMLPPPVSMDSDTTMVSSETSDGGLSLNLALGPAAVAADAVAGSAAIAIQRPRVNGTTIEHQLDIMSHEQAERGGQAMDMDAGKRAAGKAMWHLQQQQQQQQQRLHQAGYHFAEEQRHPLPPHLANQYRISGQNEGPMHVPHHPTRAPHPFSTPPHPSSHHARAAANGPVTIKEDDLSLSIGPLWAAGAVSQHSGQGGLKRYLDGQQLHDRFSTAPAAMLQADGRGSIVGGISQGYTFVMPPECGVRFEVQLFQDRRGECQIDMRLRSGGGEAFFDVCEAFWTQLLAVQRQH